MTMILIALLIGALCWAAIAFVGRMVPAFRIPLAASIMIGLSGYLLLGSPAVSGAPKAPPERAGFGDAISDPRKGLADMRGPAAMWLGLSDGLLRAGNTELAAEALQQGLRVHPRDVDRHASDLGLFDQHAPNVLPVQVDARFALRRNRENPPAGALPVQRPHERVQPYKLMANQDRINDPPRLRLS